MRVEEDHISDQGDRLGSKGKGRDPPGRCHNVSNISKVHKTTGSRHRAVYGEGHLLPGAPCEWRQGWNCLQKQSPALAHH